MAFTSSPGVLIATHGQLCQELIATAEMILGSQTHLEALPLLPGADPADYKEAMSAFIRKHTGNAVILVDLVGGTPYNTAIKLSREFEVIAIAGVNLPMLIQALELRSSAKDPLEFARDVAAAAVAGVQDMSPTMQKFFLAAQSEK